MSPPWPRIARGRLWRWLLASVWLLTAVAAAATLTIDAGDDPEARLELRRVTLPSGVEVELVVLTGERITLSIDDLTIVGRRIELDVTGRVVRLIGPGSFNSGDERLEGTDLELYLDEERVRAIDAVVFTTAIDVVGEVAERLPGQLTFADGLASPCSRCGQDVLDYAFRASRMVLYPGDRLVGYDVALLVRGVVVFRLPLIVIPLAQGDRQPQLAIIGGTATERAEVRVRWPYVAGRNALGTLTVRYLADVDPRRPGGLVGGVLGGAIDASALGFEIDHRLYDESGVLSLFAGYEPGRAEREAVPGTPARAGTDAIWTVRLRYANDEGEGLPTVRFDVARDDTRTPGRWTYQLSLAATDAGSPGDPGVRLRFDTQGYLDASSEGSATPPPYADRRTPARTAARLRLDPVDVTTVRLGNLRVTAASLDLGVFQDVANPINRRAAAIGLVTEGRALVGHQIVFDAWSPWTGARLEGDNRFEGRYYALGERAVTWRTRIALTQAFGEAGSVSATLNREVEEGETPFRFDAVPARSRTDLQLRLSVTPARWLALSADGGYVLVESRRPETVGWAPLTSRLALFGDRTWIDASLEHRWPILDEDPGTLRAVLTLRGGASPTELRATLDHLQDLHVEPETPSVAETATRWTSRASLDRVISLDLSTAYRPAPAADAEGRIRRVDPLDARLTVGSLRAGDTRPGAAVQVLYDVERGVLERFTVDLRGRYGPIEIEARQRVDLPEGRVAEARLQLGWDDVGRLDVRGLVWLPPVWFGAPPPADVRQLSVQFREQRLGGSARWEASWSATLDPAVSGGGRRDTRFEVRVALLQESYGPWQVSVEGLAEWALPDDLQPAAFLRRGSLVVGADAWERIGVQGRLSYLASYDRASETLSRSELTIDRLTLAVRPSDQFLVGARLSDVWEFAARDPTRSPWNLQPEVFFVWDRCCWALSGAWNAATGTVRIVLTGPGASDGLEQVLDTGLSLPRAPLRDAPGAP